MHHLSHFKEKNIFETMFQTEASRQRRENGVDRMQYIGYLVSEYYGARLVEVRQATSANLANLSYNPMNYEFLRLNFVPDIFLETITINDPALMLHGVAGLCNLCLDEQFHEYIVEHNGIELVSRLLWHIDDTIKINAVACLILLIGPKTKDLICTADTKATIEGFCQSPNECLSKLATYFVNEHFDITEDDASESSSSNPTEYFSCKSNTGDNSES